jgi:glycosyltransferase involved in cell wall biosynthesis
MKKISFISTMGSSPWGGSEELWANTAKYALTEGNAIQTITFDWGTLPLKLKLLKQLGAETVLRKIPHFNGSASIISRIKKKVYSELPSFFFPFPVKKLAKFNADHIVISQGGAYDFIGINDLYSWLIQNKRKYYIVCQYNDEHRTLDKESIIKSISVFSNASKVFFVSERNRIVTERQLCLKLTNSAVINNPVNSDSSDIIEYPPYTTTTLFAQVARLECNFKGQDILLQVLSSPKWQARDWHLNLYGKGPDEDYIRNVVKFYNLEEKVSFCGHVNSVKGIWEVNHILLLPSLREGSPLALAEAMLCGRTAVVTDVGGNTELIEENKNGYIADGANFTSFDKAMERAWENRDKWRELGINAHTTITSKIDPNPEKTLLNHILSADL